jgi:hypothetical protein
VLDVSRTRQGLPPAYITRDSKSKAHFEVPEGEDAVNGRDYSFGRFAVASEPGTRYNTGNSQ